MGKINVLAFEVANLIAAGEVVDRPASCVKELLENAIDAGSTSVTAEIKRGGVAFIRITDNGCGIAEEDLPTAILRHATSKIKTAADLSGIATLGFRGEALAAIASVSKLRILSKTPEAPLGAMLEAHGGEIIHRSEAGCTVGTTIVVEELFYNVPARRKFLKKDATEATACSSVVEKIALSHPEIAVKFISDGEVKFMTSGSGKLNEVIYAIYGRDLAKRSLKVDREENGIRVTGFISEPDMARANRNMENFFINGRYVKSRTAAAAIEQAYASKARVDRFPFCVINIEIPPHVVDVNVHPAKLEVKFTNEKLIFDAVYYAALNALESETVRPELKLGEPLGQAPQDGTPAVERPTRPTQAKASAFGKSLGNAFLPKDQPIPKTEQLRISADAYRNVTAAEVPPVKGDVPPVAEEGPAQSDRELIDAYEKTKAAFSALRDLPLPSEKPQAPASDTHREWEIPPVADSSVAPPEYVILGEAYNCYIIVQLEDRLLMIDKHAAHERILFDALCRKMKQAKRSGQLLLVPCEVSLLCSESEAIEEYGEKIRAMGFDFTKDKPDVSHVTYRLTQIPEELTLNEASSLFADLGEKLSSVTATVESASAEFFESRLWQSACKAAIKGGRKYDSVHLKWLCDRLLIKSAPGQPVIRTCPHGRPVAFEIKKSSIERQFARLM